MRAKDNVEAFRLYRSVVLSQAQFLEYEKKYEAAIDMYKTVLKTDQDINLLESVEYKKMGLEYTPLPVAPGIVDAIKRLQKKTK